MTKIHKVSLTFCTTLFLGLKWGWEAKQTIEISKFQNTLVAVPMEIRKTLADQQKATFISGI
jgi:hypothetical protein